MKFSTRAEYGLIVMAHLADIYPEAKSASALSDEENISTKYLERILNELRKGGLAESVKGKQGGYRLSRSPKLIRAGEIIETLEGSLSPMDCDAGCLSPCRSRSVWKKLDEQIRSTLSAIRLSDIE